MRRRAARLLAAMAFGTCAAAVLPAWAMTGEEWRNLPPPARTAYVTAIIDAWNSFAAVKESLGSADRGITVFTDLAACVRDRGMAVAEVMAIVEGYTERQPGLRGKDMPDVVFAALSEACRR